MSFKFVNTVIHDVIIIETSIFKDSRGYFFESYKENAFGDINCKFVQDNISVSKKGVIRGLHFQQPPFAQAKLVRCVKGAIFDVAVDLRPNSATYGHWVGEILSSENGKMLYLPEGFAHGFASLEENSIVSYKCSNVYSKTHEDGIIYNDPTLNINWPVAAPIVSSKDLSFSTFISYNTVLNNNQAL